MKNLAGDKDADIDIRQELDSVGIPVVLAPDTPHEVPSTIMGRLGDFSFRRAWCYWVVHGPMPLDIAEELYATDEGFLFIRANGDAGCIKPSAAAYWYVPAGMRPVHETKDRERVDAMARSYPRMQEYFDTFVFSDDPESVGAKRFVTAYHIDTLDGLKLFADTVKRHNLVASR